MLQEPLNEREFELVNIIGAKLGANQRDLSRQMALSLGMTNMLIRRLMSKGYIRMKQLNKRKVEYLLTPKGFTEKYQKSIKYTLKTINSIGLIREKLHKVVSSLYEKGERTFYILGDSDLAVLTEMTLKNFNGIKEGRLKDLPSEALPGVILICKEDISNKLKGQASVDMIQELAKDGGLA
jgi:DNA-binding MarR family transcriptional regulator